jgi:two-component system, LytTR family, sensor kinase
MSLHPFTSSRSFLKIYIGSWACVELLHALILWRVYELPGGLAIIDSLVSNALFFLLGLALWYPVYYSWDTKRSSFTRFLNFVTAGIVGLLLWYSLSSVILAPVYERHTGFHFHSLHHWRIQSGVFYYLTIMLLYHLSEFQIRMQKKQERETELQRQLKEAELQALKSQINPHFLFNSLNSISSLTMYDPAKAQEMIIMLSGYLRYSVASGKHILSPFQQEIENARRYLDIELIRFGDRLSFHIESCHASGSCLLPTLILQPLLENAVKHGVNESSETVSVRINAMLSGSKLEVTITNDKPDQPVSACGTGTGLKNVRTRLALIYGTSNLIKIRENSQIFEVSLTFPQLEKKNTDEK